MQRCVFNYLVQGLHLFEELEGGGCGVWRGGDTWLVIAHP